MRIKTLDTYKDPVRVVLAKVSSPGKNDSRTWCAAVIGESTRKLPVHR